jgi:uncharacterized membrane protein
MARQTRNANLLGLGAQLLFFVASSRLQLPLELFYMLLLVTVWIQTSIYERDNKPDIVFDTQQYGLFEAPAQIAMGLLVGVGVTLPFMFLYKYASGTDILGALVTQGVFVSFVETLWMIAVVRTFWVQNVNVGPYIFPFYFSFIHGAVRNNWLVGNFSVDSILAFIYGAVFGILFYLLWAERERGTKYSKAFGAVTSMFTHLTVNIVIILFPPTILTLTLYPLSIYPLILPLLSWTGGG